MQTYRLALRTRVPAQHIRPTFAPAVSRVNQIRLATQDYGSGDGNPAGENPADQGAQPSSDIEHPGPAPPDAGQTNAGAKTHADSSSPSPSSSSSSSGSSSGSGQTPSSGDMSGGPDAQTNSKATARINTESPKNTESEDVKRHNEEFERRREGSMVSKRDEPVEKGFHSGQGGIAQGTGDGPK